MAGVLDEFDEATPLKGTFCSRLSVEEYEQQSANCTGDAIAQLIAHLESNPDDYKKVLKAKKKEEAEEASIFSFVKVKMWSFLSGSDAGFDVTETECAEKLDSLKGNMIKAYNYSQESKGKRFSRRLAEKRMRKEQERMAPPQKGHENIPPPPPLPPSLPSVPSVTPRALRSNTPRHLPSCCATPIVHATLTRRPLTRRQVKQADNEKCANGGSLKDLMNQLSGSGGRRRLKRIAMRSPGGTPKEGWPKRHNNPDLLPYFNAKLLTKFKNTQSPVPSPTFSMASPGSFESPLPTPVAANTPLAKFVLSPDVDIETESKENIEQMKVQN